MANRENADEFLERVRDVLWRHMTSTMGMDQWDIEELMRLAHRGARKKKEPLLDALKTLVEVSPCKNGCKPTDMTCATNKARREISRFEGTLYAQPKSI